MEILLGLVVMLLMLAMVYFHIVGLIASFQKAWYIGLIALLVPAFAVVVGIAKSVFKTNFLNA